MNNHMKKIFLIIALSAFVLPGNVTYAQNPAAPLPAGNWPPCFPRG